MSSKNQFSDDPVLNSEMRYRAAQDKVIEVAELWVDNKVGNHALIEAVHQMRAAESKILHTFHNCVDCKGGAKCKKIK